MINVKKTAILLVFILLLSSVACTSSHWETYDAAGSGLSFAYLSPTDTLTAFPSEEMFSVYRKNLFTVSITVQGGSRELDEMGRSLASFYSNEKVTVDPQYTETTIAGRACRKLSLSGEDIAEGGIFFLRDENTDRFYVIYYSISKKASSEVISHVHTILDSIKF